MEHRGLWGGFLALLFLISLQSSLVAIARRCVAKSSKRVIHFMDLIITREDEKYSISRLQFYLWTVFVVIGFCAVFMATYKTPDIPQNLYLLMGVNLSAAVFSTAITLGKEKGKTTVNNSGTPSFVKDIFFEGEDSLDLPRTQMFVWTVISLLAFSVMLYKTFKDGAPALPDIPLGLVVLMGLSHGTYLGVKAAKPAEQDKPKEQK
jgi:hypothetical protein